MRHLKQFFCCNFADYDWQLIKNPKSCKLLSSKIKTNKSLEYSDSHTIYPLTIYNSPLYNINASTFSGQIFQVVLHISIASSSLGRRRGLTNVEGCAHTLTHMHVHTRTRFFDVGTELLHSGTPLQQLCQWWVHYHAAVVMCLFLFLCCCWLSTPGEPWNLFVPLLARGVPAMAQTGEAMRTRAFPLNFLMLPHAS